MKVICERYKQCMIEHDSNFICNHSIPHDHDPDRCYSSGRCSECTSHPLRKDKLKKLKKLIE